MKKIGKRWFPAWVSECIVWPLYGLALVVGVAAFLVGFAFWGVIHPTRFIPKAKELLEDWNNRY